MKLEFKFEFVINCLDKYVYVYKLDQKNSEKAAGAWISHWIRGRRLRGTDPACHQSFL